MYRVLPSFFAILLATTCAVALQAQQDDREPDLGKADNIPIATVPDVEPASRETMMASFRQGVDFLLAKQNPNGSWGSHTQSGTWSVLSPYPSGPRTFRTASTALCILGLEASPMAEEPAVQQAIVKAEDFLLTEMPKLKRGDVHTIYNIWAHSYALEAMSVRAARYAPGSERYRQLKECAARQMKWLDDLADAQGGWGYYDFSELTKRPTGMPTSFLTGTALVSIKCGHNVFGLDPDAKVMARALRFLKNQRTPAGTYVYSISHEFFPHKPINRHTGSLARTPACDYALMLYEPGTISMRQLLDAIEKFWSRTGWLTMSLKKPKPHESFAQNSGYFVLYGYYYIALCFDILPEFTVKRQASQLVDDLVPMQEKDGSWWDFPLYNYHKYYGTGYALFAMGKAWDVLYGGETHPHPSLSAPEA